MPSLDQLLWDEAVPGEPNRLRASRCRACDRVEFPASPHCPVCNNPADDVALGAAARLGPRTAVLHAPPGALVDVPYLLGLAEFDEGISILGLLDATDLNAVSTGDTLTTIAMECAPGLVTYAFRPG